MDGSKFNQILNKPLEMAKDIIVLPKRENFAKSVHPVGGNDNIFGDPGFDATLLTSLSLLRLKRLGPGHGTRQKWQTLRK